MKLTAHISWLDLNEKAKSNGDDFSYLLKFCWSFSFYSDSDFYGVWSRCSHVLVPHIGNNLHTCPILVLYKTIDLVGPALRWHHTPKQVFLNTLE